jgi:hypothetical protein
MKTYRTLAYDPYWLAELALRIGAGMLGEYAILAPGTDGVYLA